MKAYELIHSEETFCWDEIAKNKDGVAVNHLDDAAVAFCVIGAISRAHGRHEGPPRQKLDAWLGLTGARIIPWAKAVGWQGVHKTLKELDI